MNYSEAAIQFLNDFKTYDQQIAIVWKGNEFSYSQLLERIDHWKTKLQEIPRNAIVGLESDFSPETIAILYALILHGNILVPLDIKHTDKNDEKIKISQIDFLIRVIGEEAIEIIRLNGSIEKNKLYRELLTSNDAGLVLFTSGSSGLPKGAVHNFTKLLEKFRVKRKSLRTINFLLFDHWGGLNTMFHILSNGGTLLILEERSPDYVCALIQKYDVELLPTSPTFLNMLLISRAYERNDLSSLKIISYGSEPMPKSLLERLSETFPNAKLQQTYGLIELGVMRSQSENNQSLWVKLGGEGYETRVVDGMLEIKSSSAMLGYLNAPSPFTEDGFFKTGDAVEVNGEYFRILGRKSELINVGGEKVYPQEVENAIQSFPGVADAVVFGQKNALTGNIVCSKVSLSEEIEDNRRFLKELKGYLRKQLEPFKVPVKIELTNQNFHSERFKKRRI